MCHEHLTLIHALRTLAFFWFGQTDDDGTMNERAYTCSIVFASGLYTILGLSCYCARSRFTVNLAVLVDIAVAGLM
jgi:hypothetical protein